jgi:D-serine dehydratase
VAPHLKPTLGRPVQGLLRSGCYVAHDHGSYRRYIAAVNQRLGCSEAAGLQAALEVWTVVQSVPEPGLAILSAGKRDIGIDIEMPIPVAVCTRGATTPQPVPSHWKVSALNDQHAYLRIGDDRLQVGDRIGLGISHPCTTFDKWRWMAVVDADYRVVDAIVTWF